MKFINILHLHCVQKIYIYIYIYIYVHRLLVVKKRGEMPANTLVDSSLTSFISFRVLYQSRSGAIRKHLSAIIIFVHLDRKRWKALRD